jgi:hypothetical protein
MPSPQEYRAKAEECLRAASKATDNVAASLLRLLAFGRSAHNAGQCVDVVRRLCVELVKNISTRSRCLTRCTLQFEAFRVACTVGMTATVVDVLSFPACPPEMPVSRLTSRSGSVCSFAITYSGRLNGSAV